MAALSMCALSTIAVERSKKVVAATEACYAASSSSSTACSSSTQRWSKETLKAMETHLSLLQRNRVPTIAKLASQAPLVDFLSHLQAPLPFGWEQHLDLKTGRVYFMDWQSCKRSYNDPRKALRRANERINALVQQAVEGQWELQSSVTQDQFATSVMPLSRDLEEGMEVDSKWTPSIRPTEGMDTESKRAPNLKSVCSFNSRNKHPFNEAESRWNPDVMSACSFNRTIEPPSKEAYRKDHRIAASLNSKLEMLRCHHCFSHITIHVANPWCPQCSQSLV